MKIYLVLFLSLRIIDTKSWDYLLQIPSVPIVLKRYSLVGSITSMNSEDKLQLKRDKSIIFLNLKKSMLITMAKKE